MEKMAKVEEWQGPQEARPYYVVTFSNKTRVSGTFKYRTQAEAFRDVLNSAADRHAREAAREAVKNKLEEANDRCLEAMSKHGRGLDNADAENFLDTVTHSCLSVFDEMLKENALPLPSSVKAAGEGKEESNGR